MISVLRDIFASAYSVVQSIFDFLSFRVPLEIDLSRLGLGVYQDISIASLMFGASIILVLGWNLIRWLVGFS